MEFSNNKEDNKEISTCCKVCDNMKITIEKLKIDNDKLIAQNDSLATFILTGSRSNSPIKVSQDDIDDLKLKVTSKQNSPFKSHLEDTLNNSNVNLINSDEDFLIFPSYDEITNFNITLKSKDQEISTDRVSISLQDDKVYPPSTNQQFSSSFSVSVSSIEFAQKLIIDRYLSIYLTIYLFI